MLKKVKGPITKRNVIHFIASIYDPLGLINPVVVSMKCFLQKLFHLKLDWDELLPDELCNKWDKILKGLENSVIELDRLHAYKDSNNPFKIELHGFSDASKDAYGCCIYLRFIYNSGKIKATLLTGKSRVKPSSNESIPRLELLGTLLLARLAETIENDLKSVYDISSVD